MKIIKLFVFLGLLSNVFCDESLETKAKNPSWSLNPQDVPQIYEESNTPLTGLHAFTIFCPYFKDSGIQEKLTQLIEKELEAIGQVIKLQDDEKATNITGFGTGNYLNIKIRNVSRWDGKEMPVSRISLNIETYVTLKKTKINICPIVWGINDFSDIRFDKGSEDKFIEPIQKLLTQFVQNYRFANPDQQKKPIFYLYN